MNKLDNGQIVAIQHGAGPRSPHWPSVEQAYRRANPHCIFCSPENWPTMKIQVHHVHAYHIVTLLGRPDLELDPRNFVSLCETEAGFPAENHHVIMGHLEDFQCNNENLMTDLKTYLGWKGPMIKAQSAWEQRVANRPKPFPQWTPEELHAYRVMLDATLPPDPALLAKYFPNGLPKSELV